MMSTSNHGGLGRTTRKRLLFSLSLTLIPLLNIAQNMQNLVHDIDLPPIRPRHEQVQAMPTRTFSQEDGYFSACLLVMDDIHFLKEWLAYHYHVLPLRRLIVAVDPHSKTSPSYVFDRWRKHGMEIEEWSDANFIKASDVKKVKQRGQVISLRTKMHRWRQRAFYAKCLKRLKNENRTWTMLTDTDEYLTLNTYTQELDMDIKTPRLIMKFLNEAKQNTSINLQPSPCIMMPRLTYGSKESSHEEVSSGVPQPFNGSEFVMQRFRKHGPTDTVQGMAKTIIDVSRVQTEYLSKHQAASPHRPIIHYCPPTLLKIKVPDSPLVVRHYLGTWEQFSYRDDARKQDGMKTNRTYDMNRNFEDGEDDAIRPWLRGFVNNVGEEAATQLLEGVGDVFFTERVMNYSSI